MPARGTLTKLTVVALATTVLSLALVACNGDSKTTSSREERAANNSDPGSHEQPEEPTTSVAAITANVARNKATPVDTAVTVDVADGTFDSVVLKTVQKAKTIAGSFNDAKTQWTADSLLEPGTSYVVTSKATNSEGLSKRSRTKFMTDDLTLDQQTYASVTPLQDETVGVGMPVIVQFDIPVKNKAAFRSTWTSRPSPQPSALELVSTTPRPTGARRPTGSPAPRCMLTSTSTASTPETASTAR